MFGLLSANTEVQVDKENDILNVLSSMFNGKSDVSIVDFYSKLDTVVLESHERLTNRKLFNTLWDTKKQTINIAVFAKNWAEKERALSVKTNKKVVTKEEIQIQKKVLVISFF